MAQGRRPEHPIAPAVAGAGATPALAAAALLLATAALALGCGGDSAETTARATGPSAPAEGKSPAPATGEGSPAKPAGGGAASSKKGGPRVRIPAGEPEPGASAKQIEEATVASIALRSPVLAPGAGGVAALPATYTCEGADRWPELSWSGVPAGSAELALFAMNTRPVEGRLFFDWALAGLHGALTGIESGSLPPGAVAGRNSFGEVGYSICPAPGAGETYIFALYALPEPLRPRRGFDPRSFRRQVLERSGNAGLLAAYYKRG